MAEDDDMLLGAYLDGELSAGEVIALERRLGAEPALAARLQRLTALSAKARAHLTREPLPATLGERALALRSARPRRWFAPAALAASWLIAAALGAGGALWLGAPNGTGAREEMAVSSHVRALMAPQAVDVASADPHTVKPWFAGRLTLAPRVADLSGEGFPLVGGRIDVIGRTPSPTLVYAHRRHLISVIALAEPGARSEPALRRSDGHNVIAWAEEGLRYVAISDLGSGDLERFVRLYRAASPAP